MALPQGGDVAVDIEKYHLGREKKFLTQMAEETEAMARQSEAMAKKLRKRLAEIDKQVPELRSASG